MLTGSIPQTTALPSIAPFSAPQVQPRILNRITNIAIIALTAPLHFIYGTIQGTALTVKLIGITKFTVGIGATLIAVTAPCIEVHALSSLPQPYPFIIKAIITIGAGYLGYKLFWQPVLNELERLNKSNDSLKEEIEKAEAFLKLFREQNQNILDGLENANDPRYLPDDQTPRQYVCPITQEIIRDPILIIDGRTNNGLPVKRAYEYTAIYQWYITGNRTTPLSREPLPNPQLTRADNTSIIECSAFRQEIARYILSRTI